MKTRINRLFTRCIVLPYERMSLKKRLVLLIAFIIIFSITLSNAIVMFYSKSRMTELSGELIGNTIDQVSRNVHEALVGRVYNLSNLISHDNMVYDMLKYQTYSPGDSMVKLPEKDRDAKAIKVIFASEIMKRYLVPAFGVEIAAFYGNDGQIIGVSYPDNFSKEALQEIEELVEKTKKSNVYNVFSPTKRNIFIHRPRVIERENYIITVGCPLIRSDTGENFGTVIFAVPEKFIYDTYSNIKLGDMDDEIFVFSENGDLISCSSETKLKGLRVGDEYLNILGNNEFGVSYLYENGEKIMVVTKPLMGTKWSVAGKIPMSKISENTNVLLSITLAMILAAIIISLILVSLLVDNILRPIKKITTAMEEAESGNLNVSVEVSGQHEISEIAKYFNSMISRIQKLIEDEYEIENKKREAELNVLMGQINPHFLYNTLESIVWKAQMIGEAEISEMAASLGRLYRLTVNRGTLQVKVSEELEHVRAYIHIQKLRYRGKFEYRTLVEDDGILDFLTLKMILQPIVENVIVHCVELTTHHVEVVIEVKREGDNIKFSVRDNGKGMTYEELQSLRSKIDGGEILKSINKDDKYRRYRGVGLKNINDRIKLYFGDEYGISIFSNEKDGTNVSVIVPIIKDNNYRF